MTCSQRGTTDVSRQNLGRAKFKEGLETDIWWEITNIPKKIYFRIIFWWLLLALEPLIQESGDPPDTRSPTQPPPKSRLSEIKLNFHKTRLPCLSSWLFQASAKIGLITLPRTLNDFSGNCTYDLTFKERDAPQVTILAKEGRRWYGSPEVLSPQPVGNSRALLVVHKS